MLDKISQLVSVVGRSYRDFKYHSVKAIAEDAWKRLDEKERQVIRNTENVDDMIKFHHWGGRWIRNHYGLWNPRNKLTRNYFIDGDKYVRDGINYHPQHPDTVSSQVMAEMWIIARTR